MASGCGPLGGFSSSSGLRLAKRRGPDPYGRPRRRNESGCAHAHGFGLAEALLLGKLTVTDNKTPPAEEERVPVKRKRQAKVGRTGARFPRPAPADEPGGADSVTASDQDIDEATVAGDAAAVDLPQRRRRDGVGATGARFARQTRPSESRRPGTEPEDPPAPAAGPTATVRGPIRQDQRSPVSPVDAAITSAGGGAAAVRPYVLTRGRTRPRVAFPLEALVTAGSSGQAGAEAVGASLVELCLTPRSVAEVAALAGIPLGVARVLIGDLATTGALVVHETAGPGGPDLALLRRVLAGLRTL